jgi:hypothetical protein
MVFEVLKRVTIQFKIFGDSNLCISKRTCFEIIGAKKRI